ncbi:MAG: MspA protein, partial [Magnetococcales bacterium]|nr:MspA protein [Magnetococcales bacterium]
MTRLLALAALLLSAPVAWAADAPPPPIAPAAP